MGNISQKGKDLKNRPLTPFLLTISGMKSVKNRELPSFSERAQLMGQICTKKYSRAPLSTFYYATSAS